MPMPLLNEFWNHMNIWIHYQEITLFSSP
jgi:hypothetical protein